LRAFALVVGAALPSTAAAGAGRATATATAASTIAASTTARATADPARPAPVNRSLAWRALQPGVEYAVAAPGRPAGDLAGADARLHIVRIDPGRAQLRAVMASAADGQPRTAAEWCRQHRLAVAINLGMYREDGLTNVGHAHTARHVNNARWLTKYRAVLAFDPLGAGLAPARLLDLDDPAAPDALRGYLTAVQNLRLIRAPRRNVWAARGRRWSEAAVGIDDEGRVLFLFSRLPYEMNEFNRRVLALPLDLQAAMHVEGGPEASLSIHAAGVDLDLNGSYETGFNENDDERRQWPIPNVLGVRRE
jgi:hypothetical protein